MKIILYTNIVSSHQIPLFKELARRVGVGNIAYIYTGGCEQVYQSEDAGTFAGLGFTVLRAGECTNALLEEADIVLVGGIRPIELMERRAAKGLVTLYQSERWFKPIHGLPGSLRMLVPNYRKMAKRFVKLVNENDCVKFLPIGPHAKRDFLKMGVRADKLVSWGYFVEPSDQKMKVKGEGEQRNLTSFVHLDLGSSSRTLKVLWAGRDIPLKHVSDIERAVALANKNLKFSVHLHLGSSPISFTKLTGVTPAEVRAAMCEHDTFVFASNGYEGWGAVVSEALEEGMNAIGTYECGAPPTLLPKERLYYCGDVKALAKLLEAEYRGELPPCTIGDWTAAKAAERLLAL